MMPKFKLTAPHYLNNDQGQTVYLEEGTVVGDGTAIPFTGRPSMNMEGVDEAGKKAVEARMKGQVMPLEELPVKGGM
jgi:hypothetical protein